MSEDKVEEKKIVQGLLQESISDSGFPDYVGSVGNSEIWTDSM